MPLPLELPLAVPLVLAVPLSVLVPLLPWLADPLLWPVPWLADEPDVPWSCPMLLPEPLLPELPWDAELPDWLLPEAADPEPLPLPLWAIANAAETIKIAKICSKRFIPFFFLSSFELNVLRDRIP